MAEAQTMRCASILLDQYHGAFARAVATVVTSLDEGNHRGAAQTLSSLAQHGELGCHLTAPWRVVVAGAPNVGKSSLVNALAGHPRCIVDSTPGTTRDLVCTTIAVDGWLLELTDTAGQHERAGPLEREGIGLARKAAASADLCLWVLDASNPVNVFPERKNEKVRFIINKIDLPAAWELDQITRSARVSAIAGTGLTELCKAISSWLVPHPPAKGAGVPFTPELAAGIEEAHQFLGQGAFTRCREVLERISN
jgi:tRNA modification GTPase